MHAVKITGWCPFLTCLETEPHEHECCIKCGAVRHGNLFCSNCRDFNSIVLPEGIELPEAPPMGLDDLKRLGLVDDPSSDGG